MVSDSAVKLCIPSYSLFNLLSWYVSLGQCQVVIKSNTTSGKVWSLLGKFLTCVALTVGLRSNPTTPNPKSVSRPTNYVHAFSFQRRWLCGDNGHFIVKCINSRNSTLMTSGDLIFDLSGKQTPRVTSTEIFWCFRKLFTASISLSFWVRRGFFLAPPPSPTMAKLAQNPTWLRVKISKTKQPSDRQ